MLGICRPHIVYECVPCLSTPSTQWCTHLCYGRYWLCMWWHLFSWIYKPNYLLYALQAYGHAPLCIHWCTFILRLRLNAWLSTYAFMCSESIPPAEWLITNITYVWTLSSMCALLYLHITFVSECFITKHHRQMDALHYVCADVPSYYANNWMHFFTHIGHIWMFSIMCVLMFLHITLVTECCYIHHKYILLSTICELMCLHITLITKCFITHNTGIWTLSTT